MTEHTPAPPEEATPLFNRGQDTALKTMGEGLARLRAEGEKLASQAETTVPEERARIKGECADKADKAAKGAALATRIYKAVVGPLQARIESVRARVHPIANGFLQAERAFKDVAAKIIATEKREYDEAQQRQREEQDRLREEQEQAAKQAVVARNEGDEIAAEELERQAAEQWRQEREAKAASPPPPSNAAAGSQATLVGKTVVKYEVLALLQVPEKYTERVLNARAVQAALKAGVREIPGLRIWEEADAAFKGAKAGRKG